MPPEAELGAPSAWIPRTGIVLTCLVVLFMTVDGGAKVLRLGPVVEATTKLGYADACVLPIGITLLACTALYAVPRTSMLGAILLTAHLGGAVATHVRARGGVFPVVFAVAFGVLTWGGLVLREPRLLRWMFARE